MFKFFKKSKKYQYKEANVHICILFTFFVIKLIVVFRNSYDCVYCLLCMCVWSPDGVQCLIQLSLKPLAVCHGKGLTANDARRNAAENALSYLEVLHLRGKRC